MRPDKFHGRYDSDGRPCAAPGCGEAGEFRAPGGEGHGFDGPGEWRWLCLDHVREFNAGYDWFEDGRGGLKFDRPLHPAVARRFAVPPDQSSR